ncbi:hypothetical protein [Nocardioides sp.]|uniref:hypothetical protein n=1 Tax=Nocardioides sp. TaxID=35761 RepID=UPI0035AF0C34
MNPLEAIPARFRKYAYAVLTLAALALAAYKAAEGDWLEFAGLLLGSLGFGTATTHTPATFTRQD